MCISSPGIVYNMDGEYYHLGCGKITCPECGKRIKNRVLNDVRYNFDGENIRHAVFTLAYTKSKYDNKIINQNAQKYLHRVMNNIRDAYKKGRYDNYSPNDPNGLVDGIIIDGPELKYFYCPEVTKNGMIHFHVMWNMYIKKSIIENMWWLATDKTSYIVRLKYHGIYSPAGYIAKYLTKSFEIDLEKRMSHYRFSRNCVRLKPPKDKKFYYKSNREPDFNIVLDSMRKTGVE